MRPARSAQVQCRNAAPGGKQPRNSTSRVHWVGAFPVIVLILLSLLFAARLLADTISGTVKDSSGGVIARAEITITGGNLPQPLIVTSDEAGGFKAPNLVPGKYSVKVVKDGFEDLVTDVDLNGTAELQLKLTVAAQRTSINVMEKTLALANSDSMYRKLRDDRLGDSFVCENFTLSVDVGTFELKSGTLTLLGMVDNLETGAVFVGHGHFTLHTILPSDARELTRRTGSATFEEDFSEVVFRFTPNQYSRFAGTLIAKTPTPREAEAAFQRWKDKVRHRHEVPQGLTDSLFEGETMDNVDADVLAAVYNPAHPPFINAYMRGEKHKDLRFLIRTRVGALSASFLDSPEEVALINFGGESMDDGIWYSQHLGAELKTHTANSLEERRLFAMKRYNIETVIGKNDHLAARATITFESLVKGERVMKFGLLPTLRVFHVADQSGQDLHFVQESRKEDGSFYAILNEAPPLGTEHTITIEYGGDKVLSSAGSGSYYVGARESWYPNLNGFGEKALYDLTFKVPSSNTIISVGRLESQGNEAGFAVSHWVTPVPVATAGFNYGRYKKIEYPDTITHYNISGYYLEDLPDSLQQFKNSAFLASMAPSSMTKYALDQTRAQMQLCTLYFGRGPFDNVYITEQPNFAFGQSWPNLVYLPISAYIDSTQRWMLFGHIDSNFNGFVQEVTPHEVAHQWWGHAVGWASYHDQWLSEGFAEFSAGLFLQMAVGEKWKKDYLEFWDRQRKRILEKNSYGISPNDAGPLWLGLRLISPKSRQGYQGVTYSKGAYILLMLQSMMYDDLSDGSVDRDKAFKDMMHDFVESHRNSPASTESFKAIVEKHMTKRMDLQHNGRLDWFFNQWVYGTDVPKYELKYETQPAEGGKTRVHVEITQSEVGDQFAMFVPVFGELGNMTSRLGQVEVVGNSTRKVEFVLDKQPKKIVLNEYKDVLER